MGAWAVEMFTDRTCLRRMAPADTTASGAGAARSADAAQDDVTLPELDIDAVSPDRGFGFESTDLEPVIATLDQVLDDPLYLDYRAVRSSTRTRSPTGPLSSSRTCAIPRPSSTTPTSSD
jgi:hypothetical protein